MVGLLVNTSLKIMWMRAVVASPEVLHWYIGGGTEKTMKNLSGKLVYGRKSKPATPEYKSPAFQTYVYLVVS
jgi:hypothetical protein